MSKRGKAVRHQTTDWTPAGGRTACGITDRRVVAAGYLHPEDATCVACRQAARLTSAPRVYTRAVAA